MAAYNAPVPDVDPVEISIHQLFNQMVFCVNQRREAVLTEYRYQRNEVASRPQTRVKEEEELIKMKTDTERNLQMNKFQELQQQMLAGIEQKLAEVRKPQPDTRVVFRSQSAPLEQLIAELGEVLEEEVMTIPNYLKMRPVVTVGKEGKAPGELCGPQGVAIDTNNRIFITEGSESKSHRRISVFSEKGEYLTSFTHQYFRCPNGITIHGDNLYVTDLEVHAIFQFKIETDFPLVAKQGTEGFQIGEFNLPTNLAVSTHGEVYVTDYRNYRVQILNSSLQHLRSLTEQPIQGPRDIKLTADEVYVLCKDNPSVQVFSHTGERLRSLVSWGEQMQVSSPWFFCLDAERIIISDLGTHQIKIFSKEGNHIRTIGEEGHQPGMFYYPRGLALTKDLSLVVVSCSDNFRIQIFSCL